MTSEKTKTVIESVSETKVRCLYRGRNARYQEKENAMCLTLFDKEGVLRETRYSIEGTGMGWSVTHLLVGGNVVCVVAYAQTGRHGADIIVSGSNHEDVYLNLESMEGARIDANAYLAKAQTEVILMMDCTNYMGFARLLPEIKDYPPANANFVRSENRGWVFYQVYEMKGEFYLHVVYGP